MKIKTVGELKKELADISDDARVYLRGTAMYDGTYTIYPWIVVERTEKGNAIALTDGEHLK